MAVFNHYKLQEQLIKTTLNCTVVPASRPRVTKAGKAYNTKRYTDCKNWIASELVKRYPYHVLPAGEGEEFLYRVNWTIINPRKGSDRDNLDKCVLDALQQSYIILNDSQVREGVLQVIFDKKVDPLLHLEVYTLKQLN